MFQMALWMAWTVLLTVLPLACSWQDLSDLSAELFGELVALQEELRITRYARLSVDVLARCARAGRLVHGPDVSMRDVDVFSELCYTAARDPTAQERSCSPRE